MSDGIGRRHSSDLALLWLWCTPAAAAPIRPPAWEPPYVTGALKEKDSPSETPARRDERPLGERAPPQPRQAELRVQGRTGAQRRLDEEAGVGRGCRPARPGCLPSRFMPMARHFW